jgi:membrane protein
MATMRPLSPIRRYRVSPVVLRTVKAAQSHRTTGHAAEMAFFAVLTLVPSTVAVGSAMGLSKTLFGTGVAAKAEDAVTEAVRTIMGPELADSAINPFVHAQLSQPRGGVAIGSLLVAWWLSSRLFDSTGHALDAAYGVSDRRPNVVSRLLALAFALVSVLLVAVTVEMMVVGPLGDPDHGPVSWLGLSTVYAVAWSVVRWPLLLLIVIGFLVALYRFSPNVRHGWRECLPGASLGAVLWIAAAVGFRVSAAIGLRSSSGVSQDDELIKLIGQSVNAVVATVLWAYLASIAILVGGEFNAALRERRRAAAAATQPPPPERRVAAPW